MDFDKKDWKKDVSTFMEACQQTGIISYAERSRSGNGCHVWIFFSEAIPAAIARKLGHNLLEVALAHRHQIGLDSFDRMFPNQDSIPKGGFGNLIALPLQGEMRKLDNTVFLNESLEAIADQWDFLSKIKKYSLIQIKNKIQKMSIHSNKEKPIPVKTKNISVILREGLILDKNYLTPHIIDECIRTSTFSNPEFYKAQSQRLSTNRIPRIIKGFDENESHFIFPRGKYKEIIKILESHYESVDIIDQRNQGGAIKLDFQGQLRPKQKEAVDQLANFSNGILSASTGFGKTVVAAALISKRKVNTIILVHRKQLAIQWKESLQTFLNVDPSMIGQIGGGKNKPTGVIDIATIQSLQGKEIIKSYGQILVDECHHISAFSFENVMKMATGKFVHGFTATPTRKDGLHPLMFMQCGEIRFKVDAKEQAATHNFQHVLKPRFTNFKSKRLQRNSIQELYKDLIQDEERNDMLFNDLLKTLEEGRSPLVLTERIEHVELITKRLQGFVKNIIVLTGGLTKTKEKERFEQLQSVPSDEERVIIATGKYIGEGFDDPRLDTLFLAMPIAWKGTLQQYVGRLHRSYNLKESVEVYDYIDQKEPELEKMYEKRLKGYKSLGYSLQDN